MNKILILDDEKFLREGIEKILRKKGFKVFSGKNGIEGLEILKENAVDIIITDLRMPDMDGAEFILKIRENGLRIPVIVLTAFGTIEQAVETLRGGASDFLTKPFALDQLLNRIKDLLHPAKTGRAKNGEKGDILGNSPAIRNALELTLKGAQKDIPILLQGETGTGKEVFARTIHRNSKRSKGNYISVNCGAIAQELIESELFGYMKGAFTGAYEDKEGIFQAGDGGTVFLDEIGDLSMTAQVKLLRFLENSTFMKVGGTKEKKVDIRLIFATNRDLRSLIKEKKFREDLYYRINIFPVFIPSLKERLDDIEILAKKFLAESKSGMSLSSDVLKLMKKHNWPGNIRELKHFIERMSIISDSDEITPEDVPADFFNAVMQKEYASSEHLGKYMDVKNKVVRSFDFNYFSNLLDSTGWNINQASRLSGVSRKTIYQKIEDLELKKDLKT
ncbi:sigma-54-dependent Fis family transcriptional regulator [bacterium]|nr:sigma-54-dependent Fis family transcriptional regulator [bacterium]